LPKESPGGWRCPDGVSVDVEAPVGVLDLAARPANAIKQLGIHSVSQLMDFPMQEFCELHAIGVKSVADVQSKLFNYLSGASLRIFGIHEGKKATSASKAVGTRSLVNVMLRRLTKQQREVIANYYGLWNGAPRSLRGIGRKSGFSGEMIRQIKKKAFTRLHGMFGNGMLSGIVARKIGNYLDANTEVRCGVLTRDEAISCIADDCSQEQAALALSLLNDIECPTGDILRRHLVEVEPGVYCVRKAVPPRYTLLLKLIKLALQTKPVPERTLRDEILGQVGNEQLRLMERMLSISPSVIRVAEGEIVLSRWMEAQDRTTSGRAEAALLHLGRPAHLREISENICTLFRISKGERAILAAILRTPKTFVRVGAGTYGLKVWALVLSCAVEQALLPDKS
jgi:hypothetical protein